MITEEDTVEYWKKRALNAERKLKKYKKEINDICNQFSFSLPSDDIVSIEDMTFKSTPNYRMDNDSIMLKRTNTSQNINRSHPSLSSLKKRKIFYEDTYGWRNTVSGNIK